MDQPQKKPNLLAQLAKRKAEAKKSGQGIDHFGSGKQRYKEKAQPFAPFGGRNGNGKP